MKARLLQPTLLGGHVMQSRTFEDSKDGSRADAVNPVQTPAERTQLGDLLDRIAAY
jgi:hypothetical protein